MASPVLLIGIFVIVCAASLAMLITSGAHRMLFDRFGVTAHVADNSEVLTRTDDAWLESHEFWEMTATEEVAF